MAGLDLLTLAVPGERIALEVMRQALREIVERHRADPYGYSGCDAADAALEALEAARALEGES